MPVHNADIARAFEEIADLLEIEEANPFRVRAYRNAARTLGGLRLDIAATISEGGELPKLPGIGADLANKIREIAATGTCGLLERLKTELPPAITELLRIPGLGPKRVKVLYHDLGVHTIEQLHEAAREGRVRSLAGFGEKTELGILQSVETRLSGARRFKLALAAQYAQPLAAYLRQAEGVGEVVIAGSFRRWRETVGDIDILVSAAPGAPVMERFASYGEVKEVLASGPARSSVILASGIQVDLRVVAEGSFGAALHYFTGSKAHNIAVRRIAQEKGLKLNEYGVFRRGKPVAGKTEASVFEVLGLEFIPPELREDAGEIEAARRGRLPRLVERSDLRGDLHTHTRATDGRASVREMALAAREQRFSYLAITDHSRRERMAHGLDPRRLAKQMDEIERLNGQLEGITLLKGIEVDILEDGSLDLPDSALAQLDLVIGAVHSHFRLPRARQTERILRALDRSHISVLAHPSARLIGEREPCDVDMLRIIRKARDRGVFLELDAQPDRLDLSDIHCRMAKDEGVPVAVNSDAHSALEFDNLRFGIGQARRGWLERSDVLNTRTLAELKPLLAATMGRSPRRAKRIAK
ncbi:MAG: DNA polymerase/3'-5' exonuclease PolX [Betaproteobacteria bacterium]|nr:DNA polymerase/3'-5' exonuclease PolX [Betaproteobacteria bacterium]